MATAMPPSAPGRDTQVAWRSAGRRQIPRTAVLSAVVLVAAPPASAQYEGARPLPAPASGIASPGRLQTAPQPVAGRGGWQLQPTLTLDETYTDNVGLARRGQERGDWVTSVRPALAARYAGPRVRLSATYSPQLVHRQRDNTDDVYHYLNAVANAELAHRLLFVDVSATATQQNISPAGPQAESNINRTNNRTSLRTYSVSPYLRHEFGNDALGELRYTRSTVDYSAANLSSSDSDRIDARVESGPAFRLLTWNAAYSKERIEYSQTHQSIDFESTAIGGRRLLTPTLGILGRLGYEDNNYVTVGPAPRGKFWSVGPEWQPTPRTRIAATVGRRYFGTTRTLDFSHRTRLSSWRLEYDQDVTTSRSQALIPVSTDTAAFLDSLFQSAFPDPAARQAAVRNYIHDTGLPNTLERPLNYFTLAPFLQKRWLASAGLSGVRNTVIVDAFTVTREPAAPEQITFVDSFLSTKTVQTGGSLMWTHRLGPRTSTIARLGHVRTDFTALGRQDKRTDVRFSVNRQLQPKVAGAVSYVRQQNASNLTTASYRQNAISVSVSIRF